MCVCVPSQLQVKTLIPCVIWIASGAATEVIRSQGWSHDIIKVLVNRHKSLCPPRGENQPKDQCVTLGTSVILPGHFRLLFPTAPLQSSKPTMHSCDTKGQLSEANLWIVPSNPCSGGSYCCDPHECSRLKPLPVTLPLQPLSSLLPFLR